MNPFMPFFFNGFLSRRIDGKIMLLISTIIFAAVLICAEQYAFLASGKTVQIDGGTRTDAVAYFRHSDRSVMVVEPTSLGGDKYIISRPDPGIGASSGKAVKVSTGIAPVFGGKMYVTASLDLDSLSALDSDDPDNKSATFTQASISFQDDNGHTVTVMQ
jgi:hypothetical protein